MVPLEHDTVEVIRHRLVQPVRTTPATTVGIIVAVINYRRSYVVPVQGKRLRPSVLICFRDERVPEKFM